MAVDRFLVEINFDENTLKILDKYNIVPGICKKLIMKEKRIHLARNNRTHISILYSKVTCKIEYPRNIPTIPPIWLHKSYDV